jgi:hypothetical protein
MFNRCYRKLFAVWVALAGISFQALWPLAAAASPGQPPQIFHEICTIGGARLMAPVGDGPAAPDAQHRVPHCAFCTATAGGIAPPPAVSIGVPPEYGLGHIKPFSHEVSLRNLVSFLPGAARAPPVLS